MGRSAASIQAEIDNIEALLSTSKSLYSSVSNDGTSRSIERAELTERLDQLYQDLGRANGSSPMLVRGVVTGLR